MLISLIAAMDRGRVIADENGVPWSLPRDKHHFRSYTKGKAMLIGSITYLEMRGWFTTQLPIVLTRGGRELSVRHTAQSVDEAIEIARRLGAPELVVSGGAKVYRAALPWVRKMVLTIVETNVVGTHYFPEWISGDWNETSAEEFPADAEHEYPMRIVILERNDNKG